MVDDDSRSRASRSHENAVILGPDDLEIITAKVTSEIRRVSEVS
jgi:hypothetical protein